MTDKKSIVDQELIRELADLLNETGLTEIEVENNDTRIRVVRATETIGHPSSNPGRAAAPAEPTEKTKPAAKAEDYHTHPGIVLSPMVGTAYRSPEPNARPYVDIGDTVREGETVLVVEAMKTMNQIPAPHSGTVTEIIVEDGQPVEYGEPLLIIE